ncbi:MAG: autotransporter domain-containing protein [Bradyrhizobium sp.]|uniref:autotransporter family protein n=1 Tax=Bradyrhizobium sp. TaxID=376 RepID=UPI0025C2DDCC|nr:autotransporter domain-containing protein [Bradyrhizobium sp.]MBI5263121.1 autotransporter domain-containing protein [Bradyrhizobium sp.]
MTTRCPAFLEAASGTMRAMVAGAALVVLVLPLSDAYAQACQPTGTNQTCTNSVTISGGAVGILDNGSLTLNNTVTGAILSADSILALIDANVTNSGTIQAGNHGIYAGSNATVTNSGTIQADWGIAALQYVNVNNSGKILADEYGIASSNADANVTNSGTIQANKYGIVAGNDANVTNSGTIQVTGLSGAGIYAINGNANVTNSGTILADGGGIRAGANANVTNSGTILGFTGITATIDANVTNSGTILANLAGIRADNNANVTNSGTIQADWGIAAVGAGHVTNSGTIAGTIAALSFGGNGTGGSSLTLLPGSKIIGDIYFNGTTGNSVRFLGGNHNLTFDDELLTGTTVTGAIPFAVSGFRAAAVDLTPFAMQGRVLTDFTRGISDAIPHVARGGAAGGAPLAFAAPDASSRIDDAFAAIPGLSAYSGEAIAFKAPTVVYADDTAIWSRGFAGRRVQQADGVLLHAANAFYGGMLGGDKRVQPGLTVGAFIGGGATRTDIDLNTGDSRSDLGFGGVYANYDAGQTFLRAVVQGGASRNTVTRTINNNLLPTGLETATASFDGWYVSPDATIGHRFALGQFANGSYTLTPSLKLRYLYGELGGYTEKGSTANLSVGSRTVSTAEERGEVKLTRTELASTAGMISTSLYGGVLGTQRLGGATINATLLGQAIPFATPGPADVWGGFGGAGLEWRTGNVSVYSAAEYLALSDKSNVISGRAGLRVGF